MEKIKSYKLTVTAKNGRFVRYEVNKNKALYLVEKWPQMFSLSKKRVTLVYDHSAKKRGYITKNGGYYESYTGKYGTGVIYHQPNCEYSGPRYSNNYHKIFYYLVK